MTEARRRHSVPLRRLSWTLSLGLGICVLGQMIGTATGTNSRTSLSPLAERSAQVGLRVAPLPLNLRGKDPALVGYGSYLVNVVGTCNGCHSVNEYAEGGNPFLGQPTKVDTTAYLRGGANFGIAISASIRPLPANGLPAGLTYRQFVAALRHGTDPDSPNSLLQVMPWPSYTNMSDAELESIYLYLSSLPPATPWNGN